MLYRDISTVATMMRPTCDLQQFDKTLKLPHLFIHSEYVHSFIIRSFHPACTPFVSFGHFFHNFSVVIHLLNSPCTSKNTCTRPTTDFSTQEKWVGGGLFLLFKCTFVTFFSILWILWLPVWWVLGLLWRLFLRMLLWLRGEKLWSE